MQRHLDRAIGALVGIVLFLAAYAAAAQRAYPPGNANLPIGHQLTVAP